MTFGSDHYVPVLKLKRGEKTALQAIPAPFCSRITPLMEIVKRTSAKTVAQHIDTSFKGLQEAIHLYPRCLLDTREIATDGVAAAQAVFDRAADEGIVFTPVTGISRAVDVLPALAHSSNGIAIRLTRKEFEDGAILRGLPAFMATHHRNHAGVDLIIDLGPVDNMVQPGVWGLASAFLNDVPDQTRWRTLTLSACAFPFSMSVVARASFGRVDRMEWNIWRNSLYANRNGIRRLPTFSDCAIQHTAGVEGFDPRTMQVSATIRYTCDNDWLLIKGVSTRSSPAGNQFPSLARQLVYDSLRSGFAGAAHCSGCAGVKAAADVATGFGSLETWRRFGTIHHLTTVVQALAALSWP